MDLIQLLELSKADPSRATIETTVTTGFESVAIDECREKFGKISEICKTRGRIYFNIDVTQVPKVHTMRSIDNIFVVSDAVPNIGFLSEKIEADLDLISKHVNKPDWAKVLSIWSDNESFQGILYPSNEQHDLSFRREQELKERARKLVSESDDTEVIPLSELELHLDAGDISDRLSEEEALRSDRNGNLVRPITQKQFEMEVARRKAILRRAYVKLDERGPGESVLKYRVTCYRSGKHTFGSQDAACCFGGELQDMFHWIVDLELFDLEIILSIRNDQVYVSVALTKESKHRRNILHFGPTTLRATVCYCLIHLGQPRVGDIVVDPMCGGGSIPIEGSCGWPGVYNVGGESHPKAVERSGSNVRDLVGGSNYIDLVCWDATRLPFRDASVDLFVIDLPFGRRSGSKKDNRVLYREVLVELARVVRTKRGRAVLLTEDRRSFTKALPIVRNLWKLQKTLGVNIGGLEAATYVLKRRGN